MASPDERTVEFVDAALQRLRPADRERARAACREVRALTYGVRVHGGKVQPGVVAATR